MKDLKTRSGESGASGFTLVETVVYVMIFATFVGALTAFLGLMTGSRLRHQAVLEVEDQAEAAMNLITQAVRDAASVASPAIGSSSTTLVVTTKTTATNPTSFFVDAGTLYVKQGTAPPIALTNTRFSVGGLTFWNLARSGGKGSVRTRFTGTTSPRTSGKTDAYSAEFYGAATVR